MYGGSIICVSCVGALSGLIVVSAVSGEYAASAMPSRLGFTSARSEGLYMLVKASYGFSAITSWGENHVLLMRGGSSGFLMLFG